MTNSRGKGQLVKLATHIATGTEATYTYTPPSALTKTKYSSYIIDMQGDITAAAAIFMKLNGLAANYAYNGTLMKSDAAQTDLGDTAQSQIILVSATTLRGTDYAFALHAKILMSIGGAFVDSNSMVSNWSEQYNHLIALTTITSIEILTSTSTWKAGTSISIYGVLP